MECVRLSVTDGIAEIGLKRGTVNAIHEQMVGEIAEIFQRVETDPEVRAVILTGAGSFFSFGFDIPEFLRYPQPAFSEFLARFTGLYAYLFTYPKPLVAALNGHAIAGGCMLALACDYRIMVSGRAKISLNEITFGSSVFAGSVEMLKFAAGAKHAQEVLFGGRMYPADEALRVGLIDRVSSQEKLLDEARAAAGTLAAKDPAAFRSLKNLLRAPVAEEMKRREEQSIRDFVSIWYSEKTWKNLHAIKINS